MKVLKTRIAKMRIKLQAKKRMIILLTEILLKKMLM